LLPAPHTTLSEAEGELCGVPTELRGLGLRRGRVYQLLALSDSELAEEESKGTTWAYNYFFVKALITPEISFNFSFSGLTSFNLL